MPGCLNGGAPEMLLRKRYFDIRAVVFWGQGLVKEI
jgi:hypothetical protein